MQRIRHTQLNSKLNQLRKKTRLNIKRKTNNTNDSLNLKKNK